MFFRDKSPFFNRKTFTFTVNQILGDLNDQCLSTNNVACYFTINGLLDADGGSDERGNHDDQPNQSQNETLILLCDISQPLDAKGDQYYKQIYCGKYFA